MGTWALVGPLYFENDFIRFCFGSGWAFGSTTAAKTCDDHLTRWRLSPRPTSSSSDQRLANPAMAPRA
eukprot:11930565-Alexandrium_andersonii.AAC.1